MIALHRASAMLVVVAVLAAGTATGAETLIAAHRGGAALRPENSLLAFRNGIEVGADALEFDLHATRDGELVVIHDATLDRTTSSRGAVRGVTAADLASVRLKTRDGAITDEHVPTFVEVLDVAARTSVSLLPEIKTGPDREPYPDIEAKVLRLLRARNLLARATIQAFDPRTIARVLALAPEARTMLLVSAGQLRGRGAAAPDAVGWAREARATDLGMDVTAIDRDVVAAAHRVGVRVAAWTVNDERDMRRMIELGVDMLITDRPDLARSVLGR